MFIAVVSQFLTSQIWKLILAFLFNHFPIRPKMSGQEFKL